MTARTAHTPGPWAANEARVYSTVKEEWSGTLNCQVPAYVASTGGPDWQVNARLIAAAPDMLAALQACLLRDDVADCELGEMVRAAIAKAAGDAKAEGKGE